MQGFKSAVAMIYLSWNLAKNVRISEPKLFEAIKHTLMRSLRQVILTTEFLKWKGLGTYTKQIKFDPESFFFDTEFCFSRIFFFSLVANDSPPTFFVEKERLSAA
jgi:hypothetical protein